MKITKLAYSLLLAAMIVLALAACGDKGNGNGATAGNGAGTGNAQSSEASANASAQPSSAEETSTEGASGATQTVSYLGKEYEVPAVAKRIVITGALEAMEDSILLDVKPVGAVTVSGEFPPMFQSITSDAQSIGEKTEPNFEAILALQPDVILGTTKFKPEVVQQLEKIAPTILYSHIATDWEANLTLLGELAGKQDQAAGIIAQYKSDLEAAKAQFGSDLKDKKVAAVRVRGGQVYVYPADVFFNPVLYGDLGFAVPDEIKAAKAQEALSIEKFAEMNPDVLFIQFSPDENKDTPNALEELQNNPIMKNINAVKNGKTFVNVVDPLAQGGTAYSKTEFLKAVVDSLTK